MMVGIHIRFFINSLMRSSSSEIVFYLRCHKSYHLILPAASICI